MMKAKLTVKNIRGTIEWTKRLEIRGGQKGTGKILFSLDYWPDSAKSVEEMEHHLAMFLKRNSHLEIDDNGFLA